MRLLFTALFSLISISAFATVHCAEVAPVAVAARASADLIKKFGPGNSVPESDVIIGSYINPLDFIAIAGAGTEGAFAYRVRSHFENETVCVVDSVTPTSLLLNNKIKDLKN